MNNDKYVFAQLVEFLNNDKFRRVVTKYGGDHYVKHFTCWNQLLVMMFGQLTNRGSFRCGGFAIRHLLLSGFVIRFDFIINILFNNGNVQQTFLPSIVYR